LLSEKINGVQQGYVFQLELHGLGFRVHSNDSKTLVFKLGFHHTIHYTLPNDVYGFVQNSTSFHIFGIDKKKVSHIAGQLKLLKKPDLYKGKGIRRSSDIIYLRQLK
jgi:large subunit ribosomal protein L6